MRVLIAFSLLIIVSIQTKELNAQTFQLHENGVTITCDGASAGEIGTVNEIVYIAVDNYSLQDSVSTEADLTKVCTSAVTYMVGIFIGADSFNQPIGSWDVSSVTNMSLMFWYTQSFNQPIANWDVSSVTDMQSMFEEADLFNQEIDDWDVSSVTDMSFMFYGADSFNQDLGSWDVSAITDMESMFRQATSFDEDIGAWDVSSVTNMSSMFYGADSFDKGVGSWDVSSVIYMRYMFREATSFNQNLTSWCVPDIKSEPPRFSESSILSDSNKPIWGTCAGAVSNEPEDEIPESLALSQNYPNPFNPSTQIQFDLPKTGKVTLMVYNMLGQQVAILLDEVKSSGSHSINFDASALTSGTYIYQLSTASGVISKQMMLIK